MVLNQRLNSRNHNPVGLFLINQLNKVLDTLGNTALIVVHPVQVLLLRQLVLIPNISQPRMQLCHSHLLHPLYNRFTHRRQLMNTVYCPLTSLLPNSPQP